MAISEFGLAFRASSKRSCIRHGDQKSTVPCVRDTNEQSDLPGSNLAGTCELGFAVFGATIAGPTQADVLRSSLQGLDQSTSRLLHNLLGGG